MTEQAVNAHGWIAEGLPIVVLALLGVAVPGLMMTVGFIAGRPKGKRVTDLTPYECGAKPFDSARRHFSAKFYLVAMLFILFDIEAVFLYPWAIQLKQQAGSQTGIFVFLAMVAFLATLIVGFIYVWMRGALEWDRG